MSDEVIDVDGIDTPPHAEASGRASLLTKRTRAPDNSRNKRVATPAIVCDLGDITACEIQTNNAQVKQNISTFLSGQRGAIDASNVSEFTNPDPEDPCARCDTTKISRGDQIQLKRVYNEERRLAATTTAPARSVDSHEEAEAKQGINERLALLEGYLGVCVKPVPTDVYARLRAVEEQVLRLELKFGAIGSESNAVLQCYKQLGLPSDQLVQSASTPTAAAASVSGSIASDSGADLVPTVVPQQWARSSLQTHVPVIRSDLSHR